MAAKRGAGDIMGDWVVQEHFATGGNGHVYKVVPRDGGEAHALKHLKKSSAALRSRFSDEIAALRAAAHIPGIVPLVDTERPVASDKAPRWYVMPFAKKMSDHLLGNSATKIVAEFVPLARTLEQLHELQIFHRDIKPANILALDGRLCLSDFGLVTFPEKADMTPDRAALGPKFTLAPEMRRNAKAADGGAADVYSFAKSLWIALTGELQGFDGQYSATTKVGLGRRHPNLYTGPLDELLTQCTDHDPLARPTMSHVVSKLAEWLVVEDEFHLRNLAEWTELQHRLFPTGLPSSARWTDLSAISSILSELSRTSSLNHMFFPTGGGFDLEGVKQMSEEGCLELRAGTPRIIKPAFLSFEGFSQGSVWNYFWLQAAEMEATGVEGGYIQRHGFAEELCELAPGELAGMDAWEEAQWQGDVLPETARPIVRVLKGGFVIFAKRSWYNLVPGTYDGRHQKIGYDRFREEIAKCAKRFPDAPPL